MSKIKISITAFLLLANFYVAHPQVILSREVVLSFFSEAPLEDIYAQSDDGVSAIDLDANTIYFKVPIRTFEFKKSLMQQHFNENYLESDQFPYAEFDGKLLTSLDPSSKGIFKVTVEGNLTIHGVSKPYRVEGTITVSNGDLTAKATFPVQLSNHKIKIPRLVIKNIAEVVDVTVAAKYQAESI